MNRQRLHMQCSSKKVRRFLKNLQSRHRRRQRNHHRR
jgi:hypothetical protein